MATLLEWISFREYVFNMPYLPKTWQVLHNFYGTLDLSGRQYLHAIFHGKIFEMDPAEVLRYLDHLAETYSVPPNLNPPNFPLVQHDSDTPQDLREVICATAEIMYNNVERIQGLQVSLDKICTDLEIYMNNLTNKSETPLMHPEIDQCALESRNDDVRINHIDYESDEESFDDIDNIVKDSPPPLESTLVLPSPLLSSPTKPMHSDIIREDVAFSQAEIDVEFNELEKSLDGSDTRIPLHEANFDECNVGEIENVNSYTLINLEGVLARVHDASHLDWESFDDEGSILEVNSRLETLDSWDDLLEDPPMITFKPLPVAPTEKCHVCSSKISNDPLKGGIDFVIPIYCPKVDPSLLYFAHQFPLFPCRLNWKYKRKKRNRNWRGDFPFWEEFGSMEFMTVDTATDLCNNQMPPKLTVISLPLPCYFIIITCFSYYEDVACFRCGGAMDIGSASC